MLSRRFIQLLREAFWVRYNNGYIWGLLSPAARWDAASSMLLCVRALLPGMADSMNCYYRQKPLWQLFCNAAMYGDGFTHIDRMQSYQATAGPPVKVSPCWGGLFIFRLHTRLSVRWMHRQRSGAYAYCTTYLCSGAQNTCAFP